MVSKHPSFRHDARVNATTLETWLGRWSRLSFRSLLMCRGCLGPLGPGAEAGLCAACWQSLRLLPEDRCPRCALVHSLESPCEDPTGWHQGDALWDYHGGRPAVGPMLVPAAKAREHGWRHALLSRLAEAPLPPWAEACTVVTSVPTSPLRAFLGGQDLARQGAQCIAARLGRPYQPLLRKTWQAQRQSGQTATQRRRLPVKAFSLVQPLSGFATRVLLVDDVWTTGTTLLRCAHVLTKAGADVDVLTLFRAKP